MRYVKLAFLSFAPLAFLGVSIQTTPLVVEGQAHNAQETVTTERSFTTAALVAVGQAANAQENVTTERSFTTTPLVATGQGPTP